MQKIDKSQVINLPPHAHVQLMGGVHRVFFQYCYRVNGVRFSERDYLGKVDELTLEFVPNLYFLTEKPVFEERPIYRYKDETKRQREMERRKKALLARKDEIIKSSEAAQSNTAESQNFSIGNIQATNGKNDNNDNNESVEVNDEAIKHKDESAKVKDDAIKNKDVCIETEIQKVESVDGFHTNEVLKKDETRQIGASAIALLLLEQIGMIEDIGRDVFEGNVNHTVHLINLAAHAAITSKPTYFAFPTSATQLFIGGPCLSSPRASEFFQKIGADQSVSRKIGRARIKRIGHGDLLALDGTKIDCNSKNIEIACIGKDKKGGFSKQITYSLLMNVNTGQSVGYDTFAGNVHDSSSIEPYLHLWEPIGVKDKEAALVFDRGFFSQKAVVKLSECGYNYLFGVKTNVKAVSDLIENKNYEFYESTSLIPNEKKYGLKEPWTVKSGDRSAEVDIFAYRDPNREMEESDELRNKLIRFKEKWDRGDCNTSSPLLAFCKRPLVGRPLHIDWEAYKQECFLHGFFAYVSNIKDLSLSKALSDYSKRNEVEVGLKVMFQHFVATTRVHSLAALNGLMLAVFVGMNILGVLRHRMRAALPPSWGSREGLAIDSRFGVEELLVYMNRIALSRDSNGKLMLKNCTRKDCDLMKALGLEGLFDSPERVAKLFSKSYVGELIDAK